MMVDLLANKMFSYSPTLSHVNERKCDPPSCVLSKQRAKLRLNMPEIFK